MDTAGRLQNRAELMAELEKIVRVMKKAEAEAPHAVLLVLDATVGQNALQQVDVFERIAGVTGLVMTKLDGTARGGILVAIAETYGLPIHFIGVGEGADDLEPFTARDFARAIAGLNEEDAPRRRRKVKSNDAGNDYPDEDRRRRRAQEETQSRAEDRAGTRAADRSSSSSISKFGIFPATGVLMAGVRDHARRFLGDHETSAGDAGGHGDPRAGLRLADVSFCRTRTSSS